MTTPVKIAVAGALGRMGQAVARTLDGHAAAFLHSRFDRPGAEGSGLVERDTALAGADAVIDFTLPEASVLLAEACAALQAKEGKGGIALIIGSTGFSANNTDASGRAESRTAPATPRAASGSARPLPSAPGRSKRLWRTAAAWPSRVRATA